MSRIGNRVLTIPAGVDVTVSEDKINIVNKKPSNSPILILPEKY